MTVRDRPTTPDSRSSRVQPQPYTEQQRKELGLRSQSYNRDNAYSGRKRLEINNHYSIDYHDEDLQDEIDRQDLQDRCQALEHEIKVEQEKVADLTKKAKYINRFLIIFALAFVICVILAIARVS